MRTSHLLAVLFVALTLGSACSRQPRAPDGNKLTSSGHEIPKPVDDSVIEKSDETPEQPNLK